MTAKQCRVAVYARLSVNENGERDDSLETQCRLLEEYVRENGLGKAMFYVDNDLSGVHFDRPGLLQMVSDINRGLVQVVVVKDLSRLGRNNGETLLFLDYLREKNVRLVSLGDSYDSFTDDDDTIGIKTWVNEYYARDISRKVRANLKKKMRSGEFLGRPPFGYRKSTGKKNSLVVDERYRYIIRRIFELYIQGWGYRALAGYVQQLGIPTPGMDKGYARGHFSGKWEGQHIRRIITNRVYCGDTVQGVSEKISFKSRKTRRLPEDRWIIISDTHEPIVSRETYELAQKVRLNRHLKGAGRKKSKNSVAHLFTGFLVCAACGSRHVFRKKGNRPGGYVCGRYNRYGRRGCTSHHVTEEYIVRCLLSDLRSYEGTALYRNCLLRLCKEELLNVKKLEGEIRAIEREIKREKHHLALVYRDKLNGVVSEELFIDTSNMIETNVRNLLKRRDSLMAEMAGINSLRETINKITPAGTGLLEPGDIDRFFLEKYIKLIVVLDKMDRIKKENEIYKMIPGVKPPETGNRGAPGLIIVYNHIQPKNDNPGTAV